jgi:chromosome segregation ATPase
VATHLRVVELEEELKQVREAVAVDKNKLEDDLAEERRKTQKANAQFNAATVGKIEISRQWLSCRAEVFILSICCWCIVDFHRREDDLKNDLKNTKEKVRSLEVTLREVKAGGQELKRVMKETVDSLYAISQKLAYEKRARQDLEVNLEVALKSLQNDQMIIVGQEVELRDLKNAAHYAMDYIAAQVEGEEPKSALDHLIDIPDKLLTLLKATSLAAAKDTLVRVKSHYPDVDMVKVK